jgi:hypothetical protein
MSLGVNKLGPLRVSITLRVFAKVLVTHRNWGEEKWVLICGHQCLRYIDSISVLCLNEPPSEIFLALALNTIGRQNALCRYCDP